MTYTVRIPKETDFQPTRATAFLEAILKICGEGIFEIVNENNSVEWRIIDTGQIWENSEALAATIRRLCPQAEVSFALYVEPSVTRTFSRILIPIRLLGEAFRPIQYPQDLQEHDPLVSLTNLLSLADRDERVTFGIYVGQGATEGEYKQLWNDISVSRARWGEAVPTRTGGNIGASVGQTLGRLANISAQKRREEGNPTFRAPKYEPEAQKAFEEKLTQPLYHSALYLQIDHPVGTPIEKFAGLIATVHEFGSRFQRIDVDERGVNQLIISADKPQAASLFSIYGLVQAATYARDHGFITPSNTAFSHETLLTVEELATLWHLPSKTFGSTKIAWAKRIVEMPGVMVDKAAGVCLGTSRYNGKAEKVVLPYENRDTHMYVVGATRMGKSNYLHHLVHQDIANNYGVAVVDPHGKLVRDILRWSIPDERKDDVILLELSNYDFPLPLNLMRTPANVDSETACTTVFDLFERYGDLGETISTRPTLQACLRLLRYEGIPTLRDIQKVLMDLEYRRMLLQRAENDLVVQDMWEVFAARPSNIQSSAAGTLVDRVSRFYGNDELRLVLCHPEILDLQRYIGEGKIVLFSLEDKHNRWSEVHKNLLGGILVAQIRLATMSRGILPSKPFFLYIDEVQNFIATPLDKVFSEAAKFGLSLTVAHQHLHQLEGEVLRAILGNAGTVTAFRLGDFEDAKKLGNRLSGFETSDLVNMDAYTAAVSLQYGDARTTHSFSVGTLPPLDAGRLRDEDVPVAIKRREEGIRQHARRWCTYSRDQVDAWFKARYRKVPSMTLEKRSVSAKKKLDADDFLET